MKRRIVLYPSAVLGRRSDTVTSDVERVVQDLKDTLEAAHGAGLSAIQIGVPLRVMVLATPFGPQELINPEIISLGGELRRVPEGCLSLPGVWESVERYSEVRVMALSGEYPVTLDLKDYEGFPLAQAFQHEYEHFNGITMADKVSNERKAEMRKAVLSLW